MISKDGYEQIKVIKSALDSMYDKLVTAGQFESCKDEFEAIAGIVEEAGSWQEVQVMAPTNDPANDRYNPPGNLSQDFEKFKFYI